MQQLRSRTADWICVSYLLYRRTRQYTHFHALFRSIFYVRLYPHNHKFIFSEELGMRPLAEGHWLHRLFSLISSQFDLEVCSRCFTSHFLPNSESISFSWPSFQGFQSVVYDYLQICKLAVAKMWNPPLLIGLPSGLRGPAIKLVLRSPKTIELWYWYSCTFAQKTDRKYMCI